MNANNKPYAILIGDSIRRGYQATVERELADDFKAWYPEINSRDTRTTLAHLDQWVVQRVAGRQARSVVHLNCGLHDVKFATNEGERLEGPNVPLEEYKQNVQRILETLLRDASLPPTRIVWALTTPVIDDRHARNKTFIRRQADVEKYNAAASDVCRQLEVPTHDLHTLVMQNEPERLITSDGVHYTEAGNELLGQAVATVIRDAQRH